MKGLIRGSLARPRTVTVAVLTVLILGWVAYERIPMDVLPVYSRPAVQTLTFYSGMPAETMSNSITNRLERWTGAAGGMRRQESRSILGASIIRNYFRQGVDPNGALTQVQSLALAEIPNLPPGTLPPIVLPYDPTATVPACIMAVDSKTRGEAALYDVARYKVRNMIMSSPGANAPVVYGGKVRAILAYLDPVRLQARGLSALDVMRAIEQYNLFLPTGDAKFGDMDYAIDSNSMFDKVERMANIPLRRGPGKVDFVGDVATVKDTSLIQENIVRINGRREVYIPVYRQAGASTLRVVDDLKGRLPTMQARTGKDVNLKVVMDQSVYARQSIKSLFIEGVLGAVLCSLVILFFLGQWRMTVIAVLVIPFAVLAALVGLYLCDQTINVMTLAGLALAIGPLVDIAIVFLENTHRHLTRGAQPKEAAEYGASEVVKPELVATLATLLVLAPLALMPGTGQFLFKPMALAVAFAMLAAFVLAMTFVTGRCAAWLKAHIDHDHIHRNWIRRLFDRIAGWIDAAIAWYVRRLDWALRHRWLTLGVAVGLLAALIVGLGPHLRREFFPEVDAGSFEMYVRAQTGTRIEQTEKQVEEVEKYLQEKLGGDLQLMISEIGVQPDWSAAYTSNSGPMDTVIKVQLTPERGRTSQQCARLLREGMNTDPRFAMLEVSFNTGGTIRSALNEGRSTPLNIRIESKHLKKAHAIAAKLRRDVAQIDGVVDARIVQRLNYPGYLLEVDRAMSRRLGLTQDEIMKNVVAAIKSSIQFNKKNFWIDPVSENQYYVGVQYPEMDIRSMRTVLNVAITSPVQSQPVPLSNLVRVKAKTIAAEVTHSDLEPTIDLQLGVEGRDLGHVSDDVARIVGQYGKPEGKATWVPFDPDNKDEPMEGSKILFSGEYQHMQETFSNFAKGLALAVVFVYFLMVVLLDSYLIPLVVLAAVPVGLVGVIPMLYLTGTALNVQSLLGIIFMVGIVVSNTVLLTDFAQNMRMEKGLSPTQAVREAAKVRARPVVMTAVAALFALLPMALALERGSEANAPLGRAVIGGLVAGLVTTLLVVPALYSLVVRDKRPPQPAAAGTEETR